MKTLNVMLILLIFSFGNTSCTKIGKNVTIKGRVMNPVNNEPIAEKKVYLYKNNFKTIKRTNTNENGEFELSAGRFGPIWAEVSYNYKEYYSLGFDYKGEYYSALKVDKGEVMNVDYHMVPYGEIKTSLHNVNCGGPEDSLIFKRIYQLDPNNSVFQPFTFTGCYDNDGAFAKVPSGDYKLEWTVIRSGNINTFSHILFVPENGQAYYNIEY